MFMSTIGNNGSMARNFEVRIVRPQCKGCGICVRFCPSGVLELSGELTSKGYRPPQKKKDAVCKGCRNCELMCPDFAIFIEEAGK
jgi:2-oxoglutarate ferredoxin oxidoreductase subunit delta